MSERESHLRLADIADVLETVERDDDGNMADPNESGHLLSVLDHALHGDPGHVDRDEWSKRRIEALAKHRSDLDL
jgi:hypothetical protein